jgi:hypothetical protein
LFDPSGQRFFRPVEELVAYILLEGVMMKTNRSSLVRKTIPLTVAGALILAALACTLPLPGASSEPTEKPVATEKPSQPATDTPEETAGGWPLILRETFDDNSLNWFNGTYNGEYLTETVSLENGKYQWVVSAKDYGMDWGAPDIDPLADCSVSVEGQQTSGSEEAEYGLMIRHTDDGDYMFGIDQKTGEYYFGVYANDDYISLIDYTPSDAIHTDGVNVLAIRATGSSFQLFINDELVGKADDSTLTSGIVAVFVYLNNAGDEAEFRFDNFEVYGP